MCSRTVSDPANRLLKRTDSEGSSSVAEKKSSAVPLFRSGHMLAICAGLSSKGKAGVQRGRKTAGCPSFLPTAVGTASSPRRVPRRSRRPQTANPPAEVQRKTPRPSGANPPAAVRVPRSAGAGKGAARQGRTRLRQFVCPGHLVPRKEKHRRIASTVLKVCTFTQIAAAYRHPYAPEPAGPVPDDRAR